MPFDPFAHEIGRGNTFLKTAVEIMGPGQQMQFLIFRTDAFEDLFRVAREHAEVGQPLHNQTGHVEGRQLIAALAFGCFKAPHRQPSLQRVRTAQPGRRPIGGRRIAAIAQWRRTLRWIERAVHEAKICPTAVQGEQPVGGSVAKIGGSQR